MIMKKQIIEGEAAPNFTLNNAKGKAVSLEDYRGKYVIIYFYPKDDTPGCTKEACGFRDMNQGFKEINAVVIGISPDSSESHADFIKKYKLPFELLSDPDKKVMSEYKAWGKKNMYGRTSVGCIRSTVVVDPDGNVLRHWKKVPNAAIHPERVLNFIKEKLFAQEEV